MQLSIVLLYPRGYKFSTDSSAPDKLIKTIGRHFTTYDHGLQIRALEQALRIFIERATGLSDTQFIKDFIDRGNHYVEDDMNIDDMCVVSVDVYKTFNAFEASTTKRSLEQYALVMYDSWELPNNAGYMSVCVNVDVPDFLEHEGQLQQFNQLIRKIKQHTT